jgi:hypothetical protein
LGSFGKNVAALMTPPIRQPIDPNELVIRFQRIGLGELHQHLDRCDRTEVLLDPSHRLPSFALLGKHIVEFGRGFQMPKPVETYG